MGSHRQGFLHDLPTFVAFLRGETRVHSDHLMTSSLSLLFKDSEECAPTSVHDALCQGMILYHVEKSQLLNRDQLIAFCILFGCLIVKVSALTRNLEMGLCRTTSSLTASVTSLFAPTQSALFASQRLLRRAIEARETHIRNAQLSGREKTFERFGETICQHLYGSGRHILTPTAFELCCQIVLARKCPILLILLLHLSQHLVKELARLSQTSHEPTGLFLIRIQSKLKRSHIYVLPCSMRIVKRAMAALRRPFIPVAEARSPLAAFLVEKGS